MTLDELARASALQTWRVQLLEAITEPPCSIRMLTWSVERRRDGSSDTTIYPTPEFAAGITQALRNELARVDAELAALGVEVTP